MPRRIQVHCPTCHQPVPWTEEANYKPFCSERCKLIDLGSWASEEHTIAGEPVSSEDADPTGQQHE